MSKQPQGVSIGIAFLMIFSIMLFCQRKERSFFNEALRQKTSKDLKLRVFAK
jgi:hypothetical protein